MEKIILNLPAMYADHHVLAVRSSLEGIEGVGEVYASCAWKQAIVHFDPKKTDAKAIEKALADAGYPVGNGEPPILVEASEVKRDPQWAPHGIRITETNQADLEMSGEFRRY